MSFSSPLALLLLVVVLPIVLYVGWPRSGYRRRRDSLSLVLRLMIMLLLVFGLAGVQIVQSADRLAVAFLLDASESMGGAARAEALGYIERSIDAKETEDLYSIIVFGQNADIEKTMSATAEFGNITVDIPTGETNLAEAITTALGSFPDGTARRIVILSDGQPTIGRWLSAAQRAAAAEVEISYVPFVRPPAPEVQVSSVDVPTVLGEEQEFNLIATIVSEEDTRAIVTVLAGGEIITRQETDLRAGENSTTFRLRSGASGFRDFEVRVEPVNPGDDNFIQNNSLAAFSRVDGTPRVLVVDGSNSAVNESEYIVPALEDVGLSVDVTTPGSLPLTLDGLASYRTVILVNVAADQLSTQKMENVETFVSDLGGGLVVIGGPESYGPGGYYQTPLEDALPVEMQIKDQERQPELTIAYVIDSSGSMGSLSPSGIAYIDLAKEAIIRSVDFLQPTDQAAVVGFDNNARFIAEFQPVNDRTDFQRLVASLRPGGGTSITTGMDITAEAIRDVDSELKHIILLTDGGDAQGRLLDIAEDINRVDNVTISVISIGDFEAPFLVELADIGEGNYHQVEDADQIPNIFTVEAILATRTYIQEMPFTPGQRNHPIVQGIGGVPELRGYVTTTPRNAATVVLEGPEPYTDPIMAVWQYGLGRSVAFTSDATSRWSQNWVGWDGYASFWGQTVRWTITAGASANLESRIYMEDERTVIEVNARDNAGGFLNGLALTANVIYSPEAASQQVVLRQVAPGRYEGDFRPDGQGAYFIRIDDTSPLAEDPTLELSQTTGWVMSYSREYDIRRAVDDVLPTLAELTGGADISAEIEAAFSRTLEADSSRTPIWHWLLLAAVALLPFDVAVRRLLITRSDLRRLAAWLRRGRGTVTEESVQRMSTLKAARDRARAETLNEEAQQRPIAPPPIMQQPSMSQPAAQIRFDSRPDATQRPNMQPPPMEGDNLGARLLKKRRRTDDEDDN